MNVQGVSGEKEGPLKKEHFEYDFDDDDDDEPELGSTAMFEAIFNKARRGKALSSVDMRKVKEDAAKFMNKPSKGKIPKKKRKVEEEEEKKPDKEVPKEDDEDELNLSQESRDLLKSCKDLLKDSSSEDEHNEEESNSVSPQGFSRYPSADCVINNYDVDEEDEVEQLIARTRQERGELILCQVVFQGKKYPLKIYENQTVAELREQIVKKTGVQDEWLDLYHGNFTVLNDQKQIKEYGIKCLDDIDAFVENKSEKDIYLAGSDTVLRFKLQADDRRGRTTSYVYVKKSATMRDAVLKYCAEFGLDSSKVKLRFDGDLISLNDTPEDCDLEGDECIDVIVLE